MDFTISIFGLDFSQKIEIPSFEERFINLKVSHDLQLKILPHRKNEVDNFAFIMLRELNDEYESELLKLAKDN